MQDVFSLMSISIRIIPPIFKAITVVMFFTVCMTVLLSYLNELDFSFSFFQINKYRPSRRGEAAVVKNIPINDFVWIGILFLITRLLIYLMGYMGYLMFDGQRVGFFDSFYEIWNRWDSNSYLRIAQNWYTAEGHDRVLIVFYPLYPLLIRLLNPLFKNYFVTGVLISNVSMFISSIFLYKLTILDYGRRVALRAVVFLLIFPMSFFTGIVFTESLFLALTILFFYHYKKGSWLIAGLLACLSSLTRNVGILLLVPMLMDGVAAIRYNDKKSAFKRITPMFLSISGAFLYLLINKMVTGGWFTFLIYQKEHWHNRFGFFAENIKNITVNILTWDPSVSISLWIPQIIFFYMALFLLFYSVGRMRSSDSAYTLVMLFISYSPTWLLSGPRYIMTIFPIYILLAHLSSKKEIEMIAVVSFSILLCFFTIAFVTGKLIM